MSDLLTAALSYQRQGFSVIPIQPREKKPLVHWEPYQKQRTTEEEIKVWWSKWPDANVGIVTGAISGLVVIDLDAVEAKDALKALIPGFDLLSVPRSKTGKGW
jgi:putative DNA primase/helicase